MTVSFSVPQDTTLKIAAILVDAESRGITQPGKRLDHHMDLTACHANGCPLDFDKLSKFDDFNMAHDILLIERHIDRSTGKLGDCFLPRCAASELA